MDDERDAREAIERLLSSYALFLDSGDVAACADLFVDDCEFVIADGRRFRGRDELHEFLSAGHARGITGIHLPGPTLIDVELATHTATMWQSFYFVANGSDAVTRGMYRDAAELENGRWRFRRRDVELYPGAPRDV